MPYTPPAWDSVNFEGSGDAYTSPAWDEVDFNQGHVYTPAAGDSSATSTAAAASVVLRTAQTTISCEAAATSISYSVGVGLSAGASATDFRNAIAYGAGQAAGVGFASAIVTSLFASGYCRAWSSAIGVNPARLSVGRAVGISVASSRNPYLTGIGSSAGSSDTRVISYAKGAGKSRGKSFARTLPAAKPLGWTRTLYGTAFGVVVGSAGHSSGTSSSSGAA
jgi:hypothetical protein